MKNLNNFYGAICFLWMVIFALPSFAQQIVAVVNDEPISSVDVSDRVKLVKLGGSTGVPDIELKKAALEQLVDEEVKKQEAAKRGIQVSDKEVDDAVGRLEKQQKLKQGELLKKLKAAKVPLSTLRAQISADILWMQVLGQSRGSVPPVSNQDVQNRLDAIRKEVQKEGFLVAEILTKDEVTAQKAFDAVYAGAQFDEEAKKTSVAKSADKGGYVGWVDTKHYPSAVTDVLEKMNVKQMSRPVKTKAGYYVLLLLDRRGKGSDTALIWEMAQMAIDSGDMLTMLPNITVLKECDDFEKFAQKNALPQSFHRGFIDVANLPPQLSGMLKDNPINMSVGPVSSDGVDIFFMRCQEKKKSLLPTEAEVRQQLEMEQMMLASDRILRDIKRYAVIEYK